MSKKTIIRDFQEEFVLSNKYEYDFDKDVCGKTIEVTVPQSHAHRIRLKLPRWWRKYRTIVCYKDQRKTSDEDDDE
jgi:hypothetical protein